MNSKKDEGANGGKIRKKRKKLEGEDNHPVGEKKCHL